MANLLQGNVWGGHTMGKCMGVTPWDPGDRLGLCLHADLAAAVLVIFLFL